MTKIALILCTIGRVEEVIDVLKSINNNFISEKIVCDLVIVDQNKTDVLKNRISNLILSNNVNLIYSKVQFKGLSRARNYGASILPEKISNYDVISYPDDDCVYSENVIENVVMFLIDNKSVDFITLQTKDILSGLSLIPINNEFKQVIKSNIQGCSFTFFFRGGCFELEKSFDEKLGVGSGTRYGSAEEEDFILSLLKDKLLGLSIPDLYVYHPAKESILSISSIKRNYSYSGGKVYCLLKNKEIFTQKELLIELIKPFFRPVKFIFSYRKFCLSLSYCIGFYLALIKLVFSHGK